MNCLLTGATGILGSHILFEWLQKAVLEQTLGHLYVVIRNTHKTAQARLEEVLTADSRPAFLDSLSLEACLEKITVIPQDLASLSKNALAAFDFDTVIHCAASTSLQHSAENKARVHQQNFLLTQHLIEQLPAQVKRFCYISTAYSFGIQAQKVNDKMEEHQVTAFRNPYEQSKYESEQYVKRSCKAKQISTQILRPSIICGRLIEKPFFETPKYDVFYSWAIFLDKYSKKSMERFRIWIDPKSGLNIVPVDFVAKTVLYALKKSEIEELNIVNPKQILHKDYVGKVLESFNIKTYEYMDRKPEGLSFFENLYYKSIGSLFEQYVSIPDLQFQPDQILKLIEKLQLDLTLGVHENFMNLIDYSVAKRFKQSY